MRWSRGVDHACKIAGVLLIAFVLAACSRSSTPRQYGLGGEGPITPGTERDFAVNVGDVVHFQEDSSALTGEAHGILRNQARWLNQYPQYTITIEGHADERGTREYNLALGARRATAVKAFLAQSGVSGARIRTVSYGKERPIATCDAESCWNQNRRAQTILNDRGGAVARNY
ncbi:MAG TPA: peptidoglycan-associated lipoprotein Pal [Methyloceanibacter sp.]|jgi:peptidoglycan-associated lipoprotein|nr:peptidoglycan-associated lipoprotein Pal [Methyloceanibacter sp.]